MQKINKKEQFRNTRARLLNKDFTFLGHWIYNTLYLLLHQRGSSFCLCVAKFPNDLFSRTLTHRKICKLRFQVYKFCERQCELRIGTRGCRKFKPITQNLLKSCLSKTAFYKELDLFLNNESIKAFLLNPQFARTFIRKQNKNLRI